MSRARGRFGRALAVAAAAAAASRLGPCRPGGARHLPAMAGGPARGPPPGSMVAGVLTGLSYVSGLDYYRGLNEQASKLLPAGAKMARNPEIVMVSLDCDEYVRLLTEGDDDGARQYLLRGVQKLHAAGIDFLVIASNTAHTCYDLVCATLPETPVLHIADCIAAAARGKGKVGLLGTEPTMRDGSWLKERLAMHGVEVCVPEADADRRQCYEIICQELSFGTFTSESRAFFVELARRLHQEQGAEGGVILGCTEIELLLSQDDIPEVPLYRSAELHIAAASRVQAGVADLEEFLPPAPPMEAEAVINEIGTEAQADGAN